MYYLILMLMLKDGEVLQVKVNDLILCKNVEYLFVEVFGEFCEFCFDKIVSFSYLEIGIVVVSEF